VIGAVNTGPGNTWEWTDGSDMNFQYWAGSDGDVASNANRVAAARIGHDLHGVADGAGLAEGGHWDDGPASDPGHYFSKLTSNLSLVVMPGHVLTDCCDYSL